MSDAITFTPGNLHLKRSLFLDKSYMDLEVTIGGQYRGSFSGYLARHAIQLIAAAPDMHKILEELEGAFDREIEPEQRREDYDAPDDREYSVTITAKQWRALSRALKKAQVMA